ncbi:hypothetical protein [Candidatus Venteria ishoeyi]|uniref:Uncharacterized protein n=1 Tax=Candidatus Venteria ishoeyi TaxID=1899563 RepID=A0A1H6F7G9_9GAMM|nr:hypothetical protein [Candidatus Venteria ishoeyi]SEH05341.1 Uncharacterised protein [Candidatus Venteria ishoeyi]
MIKGITFENKDGEILTIQTGDCGEIQIETDGVYVLSKSDLQHLSDFISSTEKESDYE